MTAVMSSRNICLYYDQPAGLLFFLVINMAAEICFKNMLSFGCRYIGLPGRSVGDCNGVDRWPPCHMAAIQEATEARLQK